MALKLKDWYSFSGNYNSFTKSYNGTDESRLNFNWIYYFDGIGKIKNTTINQECCMSSRQNMHNMKIYIPKTGMEYIGYNLSFLRKYLKFLNNSGFKFSYKLIKGIHSLDNINYRKNEDYIRFFDKIQVHTNEFYCVEIDVKTNNCTCYESYLSFILLRYIYNMYYFDIPETILNLKEKCPNLTNWQCILIAHLKRSYRSYYSLFNEQNTIDLIKSSNKQNVIKRANIEKSMNFSFYYYRDLEKIKYDKKKVENLLLKNQFKRAITYLTPYL